MNHKTFIKLVFSFIFAAMVVCTGWASVHQGIQHWGGLEGPDRYWTIATLCDAYFGFLTFYLWVLFKESRWMPRVLWFIGIMLLGNMAMASYVLLQVRKLRAGQSASEILTARNA